MNARRASRAGIEMDCRIVQTKWKVQVIVQVLLALVRSRTSCAGQTIRLGLVAVQREAGAGRTSRRPPGPCPLRDYPLDLIIETFMFLPEHEIEPCEIRSSDLLEHVAWSQQVSGQAEPPCAYQPTSFATNLCFRDRPVQLS